MCFPELDQWPTCIRHLRIIRIEMSDYWYLAIPVVGVGLVYVVRKIREYQWGWVRNQDSLQGKVYIVTGANTGLGYETTKALLRRNATVIMACRDLDRATKAAMEIRKTVPEGVFVSGLIIR